MTSRNITLAWSIPLITVGVLICLLCLAIPYSSDAADPQQIAVKWKNPVSEPLSLSMSEGGQYCGIVEKGGLVKVYGPEGKLRWKQQVEGATDVLVARNGQSVLVYSKLNPVYQQVNFFRMDGRKLWTCEVKGCIWSGAVSADGMRAAITTGERYLYLYEPDPHRPTYRRWRLHGIGYSVLFSPDNQRVVVGAYQKPMLACYDLKGKMLWSTKCDTERQFSLHVSADSKSIIGVLSGTRHNPGAEVRFWSSEGKLIWTQKLDGFDAHALVSPRSQYVAVSFADILPSRKGSQIVARKVAVYRSNGSLLWDKGGLFFGPHLIALSPAGTSVIVSDGEHAVYDIDRSGRILSKMKMGGTVREALSTEDGRRLLIYCGDGYLYLMGVG